MAISDIANRGPSPQRNGPDCTVCEWLQELPPSEAAALESMLADPEWRYTEIAAMCADDPDYPRDIAANTFSRHAKGNCYEMRQAKRRLR